MGSVEQFTIVAVRRVKESVFLFAFVINLWYNKPSNIQIMLGEDRIG